MDRGTNRSCIWGCRGRGIDRYKGGWRERKTERERDIQTDTVMNEKTDLANEDISSSAERFSGRGSEAEGEEASNHSDHSLHHAQVVQHGDERTEVHDYRKSLQCVAT